MHLTFFSVKRGFEIVWKASIVYVQVKEPEATYLIFCRRNARFAGFSSKIISLSLSPQWPSSGSPFPGCPPGIPDQAPLIPLTCLTTVCLLLLLLLGGNERFG